MSQLEIKAALIDIAKLPEELRSNYDLNLPGKEQQVDVLVFEDKEFKEIDDRSVFRKSTKLKFQRGMSFDLLMAK